MLNRIHITLTVVILLVLIFAGTEGYLQIQALKQSKDDLQSQVGTLEEKLSLLRGEFQATKTGHDERLSEINEAIAGLKPPTEYPDVITTKALNIIDDSGKNVVSLGRNKNGGFFQINSSNELGGYLIAEMAGETPVISFTGPPRPSLSLLDRYSDHRMVNQVYSHGIKLSSSRSGKDFKRTEIERVALLASDKNATFSLFDHEGNTKVILNSFYIENKSDYGLTIINSPEKNGVSLSYNGLKIESLEGNPVAFFGLNADGKSGALALLSPEGENLLILGTNDEGGAIEVNNRKGERLISIGVNENNEGAVGIGSGNKSLITLASDDYGGVIQLYDSKGERRVDIGVTEENKGMVGVYGPYDQIDGIIAK